METLCKHSMHGFCVLDKRILLKVKNNQVKLNCKVKLR